MRAVASSFNAALSFVTLYECKFASQSKSGKSIVKPPTEQASFVCLLRKSCVSLFEITLIIERFRID